MSIQVSKRKPPHNTQNMNWQEWQNRKSTRKY